MSVLQKSKSFAIVTSSTALMLAISMLAEGRIDDSIYQLVAGACNLHVLLPKAQAKISPLTPSLGTFASIPSSASHGTSMSADDPASEFQPATHWNKNEKL